MMLLPVCSPAAQKKAALSSNEATGSICLHTPGPGFTFIAEVCLLLCAVLSGGAGCVDPGADEEGRELIQPVGTEAAG